MKMVARSKNKSNNIKKSKEEIKQVIIQSDEGSKSIPPRGDPVDILAQYGSVA